ncbi:MAG: hypothetical protein ABI401_15130 [Candidatus Dormibacter sp.]
MALANPVALSTPVPRPASRVTAAEWRWLGVVAGILLALTIPPLLIAATQVSENEVFPGYVVIARDAYVYQALWHAGAAGSWFFQSHYTSEALPGVLLYPYYLWSGHLVGALPASWTYHVARLIGGGALCIALYALTAELYRPVILRRWAFVLAALGGGVGLVLPSIAIGPLSVRATESLSPGSSVADLVAMAPHLPTAMALMCAVLVAGLRLRRGTSWPAVGGGLIAILALQLIYPQLALLAGAMLAAWAGLRRLPGPFAFALAAALIQLPYDLYLVSTMRSHPLALAAVRTALDVGDPLGFLVVSHLTTTILIVVGFVTRRLHGDLILPALWILGMTAFMFTPGIDALLGRSFMASSIPFALCAVPGLLALLRRLRTRPWRRRALAATVALAGFYGLFSLAQPVWIAAQRLDAHAEYENRDESRLLARLAPRLSARDLVLTTYFDGLFVPAQTNARVYDGHPDMTIDAARKSTEALAFFTSWPVERRDRFLRANGIDYVLSTSLQNTARLESDPGLRVIDREGAAVLFQAIP